MESFASELQLPIVVLYGISVLLPLILLAVLPVLSSINVDIGILELALIYCVGLPILIYFLQSAILAGRPAAFSSLEIPRIDNERRASLIGFIFAISPPIAAFFLSLSKSIVFLSLPWSIALGISTYCYLASGQAYREREKNRKIEGEFCDALVQLGNQMKGGRPAEHAFRGAAEASEGGEIAEIFKRTSSNLEFGGRDFRWALFNSEEGAARNIHSPTVSSILGMLVNVMEKSTKAAGEAIINTAKHLKKLKRVERMVRLKLSEIVSSMRSVALFFAPFVAAITCRLQGVLSEKTAGGPFLGGGCQISSSLFITVLGFYVVTLVVLLSSFAAEIEWGDDRPFKRMAVAQNLPVAMAVFTIGLLIGGQMLSFLIR